MKSATKKKSIEIPVLKIDLIGDNNAGNISTETGVLIKDWIIDTNTIIPDDNLVIGDNNALPILIYPQRKFNDIILQKKTNLFIFDFSTI